MKLPRWETIIVWNVKAIGQKGKDEITLLLQSYKRNTLGHQSIEICVI